MMKYNPFSRMLMAFDPENIYGREEEIVTVLRGVSAGIPSTIGLYGSRSIGKTSVLKLLCHPDTPGKYEDNLIDYPANRLLFIYIDLEYVGGEDVIPTICEMVRLRLAPSEDSTRRADDDSRRDLVDLCRRAAQDGKRLVLCLDHFDHAFETVPDRDDTLLRRLTNLHAFLVATERRLEDLRVRSQFMSVTTSRILGLLSEVEARKIISCAAESIDGGIPFLEGTHEDEAGVILRASGRQPYLLSVVCEFLFNLKSETPEAFEEFLTGSGDSYKRVLLEMLGLPDVDGTLNHFWNMSDNDDTRTILLEIAACGEARFGLKDYERADLALSVVLNTLKSRALLFEHSHVGVYRLFSEIFSLYIRGQEGHGANPRLIEQNLTEHERRVLDYLKTHAGNVCTFEDIIENAWGRAGATKRALQSAIYRIQAKTFDDSIQSEYRKGYRYVDNISSGI